MLQLFQCLKGRVVSAEKKKNFNDLTSVSSSKHLFGFFNHCTKYNKTSKKAVILVL